MVSALTLANLYLQADRADEAIRKYQFALTIEPTTGRYGTTWSPPTRRPVCTSRPSKNSTAWLRPNRNARGTFSDWGTCTASSVWIARRWSNTCQPHNWTPIIWRRQSRPAPATCAADRTRRPPAGSAGLSKLTTRLLSAYVGLGVAQHAIGETDEALASFELAASVEPNSTLLFSETARLQLGMAVNSQIERYLSPAQMATTRPTCSRRRWLTSSTSRSPGIGRC